MRYTGQHKGETRDKILRTAAEHFRARGAKAVRVDDVMGAVGLTVGGFYKHFQGKDELFEQAISVALDFVSERIVESTDGMPRVEALRWVIRYYLSEEHLRHPEAGCALAALGTELCRLPAPTRQAIAAGLDRYAERLCFLMPGEHPEDQKAAFRILFPAMAGCLMTARTFNKSRRRQMLDNARAFFERSFCTTPMASQA
jgi:TetR/AcrR family transcriptional regulator, transcriptional repressor for nem operon